MQPDQVSAVIVTRGDVDLSAVRESLIFDDVVVWDNSREAFDQMTFGRVLALKRCKHKVIYSQDDDLIHTTENQQAIIDAYEPGILTGCMWAEWSKGAKKQGIKNGYEDLVFPGSGSVYDVETAWKALDAYLDVYPFDDFCRLWCDTIIGVLAPTRQLDIRFEPLAVADNGNRMANLPDAVEQKTEAIMRARAIRDAALVGA